AQAPVDPFYRLGPGDQLIINLWGKRTATFNPRVDDNGFITLRIDDTDIRFSVNGLEFQDLHDYVTRELARFTSDIDPDHPESSPILVDVGLGAIRGIAVIVVGEVKEPGQYTLKTTTSSAFNALAMAGGLTENGSLREIMVRRPGNTVDRLDLYQLDLYNLLTSGTLDEDLFHLRNGDIMVVPPRQRVVTVRGEVKRPGLYEIVAGETIKGLLELAGGFTAMADPGRVNVLRVKTAGADHFISVNSETDPAFRVMDGDEIEVTARPAVRRMNIVEIKGGGIRQPGMYAFEDGMTLTELIEKAGGVYEDAMLNAAVLVRMNADYSLDFSTLDISAECDTAPEACALQPMDKLIIYSRYEQEGGEKYVSVSGHVKEPGKYLLSNRMTLKDLLFMAGGFADQDFLSRTWLERADLTRIDPQTQRPEIRRVNLREVLQGRGDADLLLQSMDRLRVYAFSEMQDRQVVFISGEVRKPGEYELTRNMTLCDLLSLANGLTDLADRNHIEIARFPSAARSDRVSAESLTAAFDPDGPPVMLERNDRVLVRRRPEFREKATVTVAGYVTYPGAYVLLNRTQTLSDIVKRAGGFIEGAMPEGARLYRAVPGGAEDDADAEAGSEEPAAEEIAVDLARAVAHPHSRYDMVLLDGDRLDVPPQNWMVRIEGAVRFPQAVQYVRGRSAYDYIAYAGGFTRRADKGATVVIYPNGAARKARRWFFFSRPVKPGSRVFVPAAPSRGEAPAADDTQMPAGGSKTNGIAAAGTASAEAALEQQEPDAPTVVREEQRITIREITPTLRQPLEEEE
ncbi:MAG: SLBB domain-containing protein, partial [Lentisphaerae bacterium]|nr:SLBB domain-containing protein [Lentisphaerota bacterium]